MATNAYTDRMASNEQERISRNDENIQKARGPLMRRPGQNTPSGLPIGASPKPQEDTSHMDTDFYHNFDYHRQNDHRFDGMTAELTQLATGLREQVKKGYMPPQLAEARIHDFVMDSMAHAERNAPIFAMQDAAQDHTARQQALLTTAIQNVAGQGAIPASTAPESAPDETSGESDTSAPAEATSAPDASGAATGGNQ